MLALDKKLWRELWAMRIQALAIAMVLVSGVGIFIMALSTLHSLQETRDSYYRSHHFADVFATLKRAPVALLPRIESIPGINKVDHRVVAYVNLDVPGYGEPVSGHLLSLPDNSRGLLNQIYLRQGRLFEPGRDDEIVISEEFALAHHLKAGDKIYATINGRRKQLTITGMAFSPEYIQQIAPGAMFPDYKRYGVLWMARKPLASAYDMDGAFNNLTLTLTKNANVEDVIDRLDDLLKPYGGTGAIARKDQLSNRFLTEELRQQKTIATIFPVIFFAVTAFLLNVVISRVVSLQREQIAVLKAFGYSRFSIALHYSKLVLMIVTVGVIIGIGVGIWMGEGMSNIYTDFYSLPFLVYVLKPQLIIAAVLISFTVAIIGTLFAVRNAASLQPAQAMRPEVPTTYRATVVERLGLQRYFSQPTRMILRHIERRPLKSLLTTLGISMAYGIMMVSGFQEGAINQMVTVEFGMSQQEDLVATYTEPTSMRSLYQLRSLEGVQHTEGMRIAPVRLSYGHRSYRTAIKGLPSDSKLMRLLDSQLKIIDLPEQGVVITDYLADMLHIKPGDTLTVEVLEGNRPVVKVPVIATAKQYMGVFAYTQRAELNRLLKEDNVMTTALIQLDQQYVNDIYAQLKGMPRIAGVVEQRSAIRAFNDTMAENILFFTFITTLFGASIAFGIIFNSMRIALSERSRELASLRVLGFRQGEIAYILLGEMALLTLIAIPVGMLIGYGLCAYMANQFDSDLYRVPLVLGINVYAFSALVVIIASFLSALMIGRNLRQLDMVTALKTKE
jgi:putative ABC transport system permease protein